MSYADLTHEAELFLGRFHPKLVIPVPIEEIVELRMDLEVIPYHGLRDATHVDAFVTRDGRAVYVDYDDYVSNQPYLRFTFGEEAAHVWLHGALLKAYPIGSFDEWLEARAAINRDLRFESQAKDLAGLILVPERALRAECRNVAGVVRQRVQGTSKDAIRPVVLALLARRFEVSEQVIDIRISRDGLWGVFTDVTQGTTETARRAGEVA